MTNIGGHRKVKRRLLSSVVYSKLFYAAPVWQVPFTAMLSKKAVLGTERSGAENSLSIPNCVDECCVCPGKRSVNRLIVEGKTGDLSAPQGAHLCDKQTVDRHLVREKAK